VLPASVASLDLAQWRSRPGELAPLAALPPDLVLRGSGDTTTPSAGLALTSINPTRASSAQTTQVSLNGNGFLAGGALSVRFVPVASPSGTFLGSSPTVVSSSVITVKIPAGSPAQDYVVELTNGDGSSVSSRAAFTVTP
jgi:hypothetical protein